MNILGVDPGGTCGLAVIRWEGELPARAETSPVVWSGQLGAEGEGGAEDALRTLLVDRKLDLVAIERFTIGPGTHKLTRSYDALYLIGLTRALCRWNDVPMIMQQPASAKTAYSDDRLRELGYWVPGDHARDAMRHALLSTHLYPL